MGISTKAKNRLNTPKGRNLHFGLVITLKEINGKIEFKNSWHFAELTLPGISKNWMSGTGKGFQHGGRNSLF